jgi:hypothetical protein
MATPVLIMGVGGGAKLLAYDPAAATDDGVAVPLRARSQELALSGAEAETSVFALLVVVTHTAEVALVLTPILDGVPQDGSGGTEDLRHTIALDAVPSRQTRRFELATETPIRDPRRPGARAHGAARHVLRDRGRYVGLGFWRAPLRFRVRRVRTRRGHPHRPNDPMTMLRQVKVEVISAADAAALTTAVNDWIAANAADRTFLSVDLQLNTTDYAALISYTE